MNVCKFGWLSARRRLLLIGQLQDRVGQWMRDWSLQPTIASVSADDAGAPGSMQSCHRRGDALHGFSFEAGVLARLGAHLADVGDAGDSLLARDVGVEALRDLAVRLLGAVDFEQIHPVDPATLPSTAFDPRHGALSLMLGIDGIELSLALNASAIEALVPSEPAVAGPLSGRSAALSTSEVDLDLVLPLGEFALDEVLGLNLGDVLLSDVPLDMPFQLNANGNNLGLRCRLARIGERKAAYIDEPEATA